MAEATVGLVERRRLTNQRWLQAGRTVAAPRGVPNIGCALKNSNVALIGESALRTKGPHLVPAPWMLTCSFRMALMA